MKFRIYVKTGRGPGSERQAVDYESNAVPALERELVLPDGRRILITHVLDDDPPGGYTAHLAATEIDRA